MQLMELAAHVLLVSIIPHTASSYRNWTSVSLKPGTPSLGSHNTGCQRSNIPHVLLLYLKCVEQTAPFLFAL